MKKTILFSLAWLICFFAKAQAPNWSVTPANFQYTSTLTGTLIINDTLINSSNNVLGAFVNGQVRGVASPTNVGGTQMYFITLYSNVASGEFVTFQAYIGDQDSTHNVVDSVLFTSNASYGDPVTPFPLYLNQNLNPYFNSFPAYSTAVTAQFNPVDLASQTVNNGNDTIDYVAFNSTNLTASVVNDTLIVTHLGSVGLDSVLVQIVDSNNVSTVYDQQYLYFEVVNINDSIYFNTITPFTWGLNSNSCIDLSSYLVNTDNDSIQWQISGTSLDSISDTAVAWNVTPSNFQYTMNLTVQPKINGAPINNGNYLLGAFNDTSVIGVSAPQLVQGKWVNFLTVYSDSTNTNITFKLWDSIDSIVLDERSLGVNFVVNGVVGDIVNPYDLEFGNYTYSLTDSMFCVTLFDSVPGIIDSFQVIATEMNTNESYSDTALFSISFFMENQPLLNGIPDETIMLGNSFTSFDLDNYLTELDGDSVIYFVSDTNNITIQIDANNVVTITPNNSSWLGSDTITFMAMDSTTNMLSDYQQVIYSVIPTIDVFGIADQSINFGGAFSSVDLSVHLNYSLPDSINWTVTSSALNGVIVGTQLDVYFATSNWVGSDTLYIQAMDMNDSTIFDIDTAIYTVLPPSGINEIVSNDIQIYPVPNNGNFSVNISQLKGDLQLQIIDASGRIIDTRKSNNRNSIEYQLSLDSGIYFVKVTSGKSSFTKPIIIR